MNDTTIVWTIDGFDGATTTLTLRQVDTLTYGGDLAVPVWQVADPAANDRAYSGPFVRYVDMPKDVAEAFKSFQFIAQIPFQDAAYDHDFRHFISRHASSKLKSFR
jgi:hypothetical protein